MTGFLVLLVALVLVLFVPMTLVVRESKTNRNRTGIVAIIIALLGVCITEILCKITGVFEIYAITRQVVYLIMICAVIFCSMTFMDGDSKLPSWVAIVSGLLLCALIFGGLPVAIKQDQDWQTAKNAQVEVLSSTCSE